MRSTPRKHVHAYVSRSGVERNTLVSHLPHRFAEAWNRHDMDAAFADFHDDAEFVDVDGERYSGWEEITAKHAELHETIFAHCALTIDEIRIRLITVDSAYVHADWTMRGLTDGPGAVQNEVLHGTLIFVVARQGTTWRVFAAQNTERVSV